MQPKTLGIMKLMKEQDAAEYLGFARGTLKQSRVTGVLAGLPTPAFIKIGYSVRYKLTTLDEWLSQLSETQK